MVLDVICQHGVVTHKILKCEIISDFYEGKDRGDEVFQYQ
jgi:hypothetical protein